jgi:hypothetical protein
MYVPATQWVQTEAPAAEYVPKTQSPQDEAPAERVPPDMVCNEYLPATQLVQLVLPDVAWYLPAAQLSHSAFTPDVALNLPSAQSVQTVAPAAEYLPAAQSVQTSLVCNGEPKNLPPTQSMQTEAPAAEYLPAPQSAQVEDTLAPTASENLPAAQLPQPSVASCAAALAAPQTGFEHQQTPTSCQ